MHRYGRVSNSGKYRHLESYSDDFSGVGDEYRDLAFEDEPGTWDTSADDGLDSTELDDDENDDSLWEADRLDDSADDGWRGD